MVIKKITLLPSRPLKVSCSFSLILIFCSAEIFEPLYEQLDVSYLNIIMSSLAPWVDFIQIDRNSDIAWNGQEFCVDKELYALNVNDDKG